MRRRSGSPRVLPPIFCRSSTATTLPTRETIWDDTNGEFRTSGSCGRAGGPKSPSRNRGKYFSYGMTPRMRSSSPSSTKILPQIFSSAPTINSPIGSVWLAVRSWTLAASSMNCGRWATKSDSPSTPGCRCSTSPSGTNSCLAPPSMHASERTSSWSADRVVRMAAICCCGISGGFRRAAWRRLSVPIRKTISTIGVPVLDLLPGHGFGSVVWPARSLRWSATPAPFQNASRRRRHCRSVRSGEDSRGGSWENREIRWSPCAATLPTTTEGCSRRPCL